MGINLDDELRQKAMIALDEQCRALQAQLDTLTSKYQVLVKFYDEHNGTPCEQIRHKQEIDALKEQHALWVAAIDLAAAKGTP